MSFEFSSYSISAGLIALFSLAGALLDFLKVDLLSTGVLLSDYLPTSDIRF
jgi:hypothetical protein